MFEEFYRADWPQTFFLFSIPLGLLFFLPRKKGAFSTYLWLFTLMAVADPLMTGPLIHSLQIEGPLATAVPIFFVIFGDLRFFAVLEQFRDRGESGWENRVAPWWRAIAWSFLVPVLQALLIQLFPDSFENPHATYLVYEILFFFLASFFLLHRAKKNNNPETARWLKELCLLCMLYYCLWASADVFILLGYDWGFALRLVPNLLYYGLFLPLVLLRAPGSLRES